MNNEFLERLVIKGILHNKGFARVVFDKFNTDIFDDQDIASIFKFTKCHFEEYEKLPTQEVIINSLREEAIKKVLAEVDKIETNVKSEQTYLVKEAEEYWLDQTRRCLLMKMADAVRNKDYRLYHELARANNELSTQSLSGGELDEDYKEYQVFFDDNWLIGSVGRFTHAVHTRTKFIKQYLYFSYLTCLGSIFSDKVKLDVALNVQPRFYTLLLGESGNTIKSTTTGKVLDILDLSSVFKDNVKIINGAGSAQGLGRVISKHSNVLFFADEFSKILQSAAGEGNTMLQAIAELFERNVYDNYLRDKKNSIKADNAYLSILSSCTPESFQQFWNSKHSNIGLGQRFFLVPANPYGSYFLPPSIPESITQRLLDDLTELSVWLDNQQKVLDNKVLFKLSDQALTLNKEFNESIRNDKTDSKVRNRLNAYLLRIALILAISCKQTNIDEKIFSTAVSIMNWQKNIREEFMPSQGDNPVAVFEQKILNLFKSKKSISEAWIDNRCDYLIRQKGLWSFQAAMKNLISSKKIIDNGYTQMGKKTYKKGI